jgi:hypothetical protein
MPATILSSIHVLLHKDTIFLINVFKAIKMLGVEKGKKNKTNVTFVAGGRLLKYLDRSYQVERELTAILK